MAKKYQVFKNKVHWLTWTIIGVVVVALTVLTIALQPSAKKSFYNEYLAVTTEANFSKKLPENNKFNLVNSLNNKLFTKGLYSIAENDDKLSIVFFGDASDAASAKIIASVYARLYGSQATDPVVKASNLFTTLGDEKMALYHYAVPATQQADLVKSLNEKYEDAEIIAATLPMVIVFLDGVVVDFQVFTDGTSLQVELVNFYNDVLASDAVQALK